MKISGPGVSQNILDIEGNAIKKKKKRECFWSSPSSSNTSVEILVTKTQEGGEEPQKRS